MGHLYYLKQVDTWINPMQISSIYRAADSRHVTMANGSDYTVAEDEYVGLIEAFNHKTDGDEKHEDKKEIHDMLKTILEKMDKKED